VGLYEAHCQRLRDRAKGDVTQAARGPVENTPAAASVDGSIQPKIPQKINFLARKAARPWNVPFKRSCRGPEPRLLKSRSRANPAPTQTRRVLGQAWVKLGEIFTLLPSHTSSKAAEKEEAMGVKSTYGSRSGLAPIVDDGSTYLVLGTFPAKNHCWRYYSTQQIAVYGAGTAKAIEARRKQ
jgi:hypothetical protein